jgi:hypothetical protein
MKLSFGVYWSRVLAWELLPGRHILRACQKQIGIRIFEQHTDAGRYSLVPWLKGRFRHREGFPGPRSIDEIKSPGAVAVTCKMGFHTGVARQVDDGITDQTLAAVTVGSLCTSKCRTYGLRAHLGCARKVGCDTTSQQSTATPDRCYMLGMKVCQCP